MQMVVGMASGEDARGRSVPTGPCILGRNGHRAHHAHILHQTLLGASPEECIQKEGEGLCAYAITFMDELAMQVPSLDAWDQFVWPPAVAMPWATMEAEQYGYCHGQAIDLGPIMLATQFRVTDEAGTYLCAVWALVFEGSVLAYMPWHWQIICHAFPRRGSTLQGLGPSAS